MELSDNLEFVTLQDLQWAVKNNYECSIPWVAMNVVSILCNKSRLPQNKKEFKKLTGRSLYVPTSSPANKWSGCYDDVVLATCFIIKGRFDKSVESAVNHIPHNDYEEYSIRLRRFTTCKRNPVYGHSVCLKKDELGNFYMWNYNKDRVLTQISEQGLKFQLMLWDSYHHPLIK